MAQVEPKQKKLKHSIISDFVYSADFQRLFSEHWCNLSDIKKNNLEIISKPFRICKISNFLSSEEFMDEIKNELLDVKSRRNSIDLYQFEQTNDLVNVDAENLKLLHKTFQTDLALWMEKNTKIQLNKTLSMSSSCYYDTDYLLCHDDNMDDRRIAFILYLSKNWTREDGGTLDLFDTDKNGLPRNIVKSLIPEYNSLVFFEVADNSYHQVAEVVSPDKSRWSINGWFHGPLRESHRPPRPEMIPNYIEPINIEVDLHDWVTKCYLTSNIIKEVNQNVEQESFAFLAGFVKMDIYEKLVTEVASDTIVWQKCGPADIRNYEIADENSLPELLKSFYNFFKSISMCRLLKNYTELNLVPEKEASGPKMVIELQRWSKGCYTLISDKSTVNESDFTENEKKTGNNGCVTQADDVSENPPSSGGKPSKNCEEKPMQSNTDKTADLDSNSPVSNKEDEDVEDDDMLKKILKAKCFQSAEKDLLRKSSLTNIDNSSLLERDTDSDESDIGDYLSDLNDRSLERSDQENEADESNASESGSLDVILQFHTHRVPEEHTIDYVDPKEQDAALIHIPPKDNHLCIVYKVSSTCRFHKYVNHYCTDYFYNLICTYYEQ